MKSVYLTIFLLAIFSVKAQQNITIPNISLFNTVINNTESKTFQIMGIESKGIMYDITSQTEVQVWCSFISAKYEVRKNKYRIYYVKDSNCIYFDSICSRIRIDYEKDKPLIEEPRGHLFYPSLNTDKVFMIRKDILIPIIRTSHQRSGAYFIFYYKQGIYKIELIHSEGFGGISSFTDQNIKLIDNEEPLEMNGFHPINPKAYILGMGKLSCEN